MDRLLKNSAVWGVLAIVIVLAMLISGSRGMQSFPTFIDVSDSHLPVGSTSGRTMDAEAADVDNDGDLDLILASEFAQNRVLINDGAGIFSDETTSRIPVANRDSEDIAIADFNGDGALDIVFVSEDDQINEYYLNDGSGFFQNSQALPVAGTSNAVIASDLNGDDSPDLILGNAGQNVVLINDGFGNFSNETALRLPVLFDSTQDLELGDIDADGDLDLIVANEDGNRLLINTGDGFFDDQTSARLPTAPSTEETREADFGDADGDGDLDIFLANVAFRQGKLLRNKLLINDGTGHFSDETESRLEPDNLHSVDGDFVDLDGDDDLDLIIANAFGGNYQVLINDGAGFFSDQTNLILPVSVVGDGIDIEAADFDGDGILDLYLTNFQGADFLLLANTEEGP